MDLLNAVARVVLPIAVAAIMFCLGLELKVADFKRLLRQPRLLAIAVPCQILLLPLLALTISRFLQLNAVTAAGLILVAACPVSAPASLLARLARGNVAGAIALTALTAPASAIAIPAAIAVTAFGFEGEGAVREISTGAGLSKTALSVAAIAALPVLIGMIVRARTLRWNSRIEWWAVRIATWIFAIGLAIVIASCWSQIPEAFREAGLPALLLNLSGIAAAYGVAYLARLAPAERVVVLIGSTTRQFAVAGFVALTLCNDVQLLLPAIAYCLIMWAAAGGAALAIRRRHYVPTSLDA